MTRYFIVGNQENRAAGNVACLMARRFHSITSCGMRENIKNDTTGKTHQLSQNACAITVPSGDLNVHRKYLPHTSVVAALFLLIHSIPKHVKSSSVTDHCAAVVRPSSNEPQFVNRYAGSFQWGRFHKYCFTLCVLTRDSTGNSPSVRH